MSNKLEEYSVSVGNSYNWWLSWCNVSFAIAVSFSIRFSDLISENGFVFKAQSTWPMTKPWFSTDSWTVWWEEPVSGFKWHFVTMGAFKWLSWFDTQCLHVNRNPLISYKHLPLLYVSFPSFSKISSK